MAGIESPSVSQEVDGISFVSLLKVEPYAHKDRSLIWYNPHTWTATDGPGINYFSAIRQGNWKLIYDFKKEKLELYDYSQDIGEHRNLIRKHRATALKLAKSLTTQLKAWNVVLPTYKSTGKSLPWPDEKAHSLSL